MDVSIIIPIEAAEAPMLGACLEGIRGQRYGAGRIETLIVQYGAHEPARLPFSLPAGIRSLSTDRPTPYAARNRAAAEAVGDALLFTEAGCVPEPDWVAAHVARFTGSSVTVSVGHVAPAASTRLVDIFCAYEKLRDEWVFSGSSWRHYFGRPRNMAVLTRRFETHGPFVEVPRGSDSKLVQTVAREVSCDEVGLTQNAVVKQQSIRGLASCFQDRFGHSHALTTHQSAHAAPIALGDRIALFRNTVRRQRYGAIDAATLLALLATGIFVFRLGGWIATASRAIQR